MVKKFVGQEYMAATNGKGLHQNSPEHRFLARTTITVSSIITIVSVLIVVFCLIFQLCPVSGTSMMTTLNASGDDTDKVVACTVGSPKTGDIIIMKLYMQNTFDGYYLRASQGDQTALDFLRQYDPNINQQDALNNVERLKRNRYKDADKTGNYELIIKRLIAKGGDRISMRQIGASYYLYLNGVQLDENYLDDLIGSHDAINFKQLWNVLNLSGTKDYLKDWVTTDLDQILSPNTDTDGKGYPSTYMLTVPENYYFVLGDNRGGAMKEHYEWLFSWDSSYWGPIPVSNYYSYYVDKIDNQTNLAKFLMQKFVYYVCFGWAWQK